MSQYVNKPMFKIGIGYDVHRFDNINKNHDDISITICGVKKLIIIKIIAHSDGDVGLHALADAILGAVGCGSIGEHFPNTDKKWKNVESRHFEIEAQKSTRNGIHYLKCRYYNYMRATQNNATCNRNAELHCTIYTYRPIIN